jgi:hypothetical protein
VTPFAQPTERTEERKKRTMKRQSNAKKQISMKMRQKRRRTNMSGGHRFQIVGLPGLT